MAPGADIQLIVSATPNNTDMFGSWGYAISNHLGQQISNSWSGRAHCKSFIRTELTAARQAHVTLLASAGDAAAWGSGTSRRAGDPADCAPVMAVGGTSLSVTASGAYRGESAWYGTGGGYVPGSSEPKYQSAAKISDPYGEIGKVDVAAVADPGTGVWIYNGNFGGWTTVGGTSVACPIWAALVADANALRASHTYPALGAFTAYLYRSVYGVSGGGPTYGKEFHDVTTGSNGWSAGTGWDVPTGLGSMNAGALVGDLGNTRAA